MAPTSRLRGLGAAEKWLLAVSIGLPTLALAFWLGPLRVASERLNADRARAQAQIARLAERSRTLDPVGHAETARAAAVYHAIVEKVPDLGGEAGPQVARELRALLTTVGARSVRVTIDPAEDRRSISLAPGDDERPITIERHTAHASFSCDFQSLLRAIDGLAQKPLQIEAVSLTRDLAQIQVVLELGHWSRRSSP